MRCLCTINSIGNRSLPQSWHLSVEIRKKKTVVHEKAMRAWQLYMSESHWILIGRWVKVREVFPIANPPASNLLLTGGLRLLPDTVQQYDQPPRSINIIHGFGISLPLIRRETRPSHLHWLGIQDFVRRLYVDRSRRSVVERRGLCWFCCHNLASTRIAKSISSSKEVGKSRA